MLKVVVTDSGYGDYSIEERIVRSVGARLEVHPCVTQEDVIAVTTDADGVIVRQQPMGTTVIAALKQCRVIARYGVGVDNIDLEAATQRGIIVARVTNSGNHEVAEHAIALLMACVRRISSHDRRIRMGEWDIGRREPIHRMQGRTLGVIGMGEIARTLIRKLRGFEFKVIAHDPFVDLSLAKAMHVELMPLEQLLAEADYVSLHAPLTPQTRHIINRHTLGLMKPGAILVNTSRGGLIDVEALAAAIAENRLTAVGIDTHQIEPIPTDYPLLMLENAVLSDHKGWYSEESLHRLQTGAAEAVAAVLSGGLPTSIANPSVLKRLRNSVNKD